MSLPTREVMLQELQMANIDVPENATVAQIKRLYAELPSVVESIEHNRDTLSQLNDNENNASINLATVVTRDDDELDRQIELMRKQKELLLLQKEVENLSRESSTPPNLSHTTDVNVIETMVSRFTADDSYDVRKWFDDLEDASNMLQFDERLRFIACRRLVDGTAKLFLRTISVFHYSELKAALITEFGTRRTIQEVYAQLIGCRLKPGESIRHYILKMQEIAMKSSIPEAELVDIIIDGIGDSSVNASILYAATTIQDLKGAAQRYERKRLRPINTSKTNVLHTRNTAFTTRSGTPSAPTNTINMGRTSSAPSATISSTPENPRCFNCSKYGHYQSQCPVPKRPPNSCFKCSSTEHVYRNCPRRMADSTISAVNLTQEDAVMEQLEHLHLVSVAYSNEQGSSVFNDLLCLFDSGSPRSFIRYSDIPSNYIRPLNELKFHCIGNHPLQPLGTVKCNIRLMQQIFTLEVFILQTEDMPYALLLGRDFFEKAGIKLTKTNYVYSKKRLIEINKQMNYENIDSQLTATLVSFDLNKNPIGRRFIPNGESPKLGCNLHIPSDVSSAEPYVNNWQPYNLPSVTDVPYAVCNLQNVDELSLDLNPLLPSEQIVKIQNVVSEVYSHVSSDKICPIDYHMKIQLTSDTPISCRPRRLSHYERSEIRKIVKSLQDEKIIRFSNSPYASAIVPIQKKNGELRLCVDYRPINKITVRDNYPLPFMEDCIEHLGGKRYFTVIDLKNGFHHVKMHPDSVPYTAFVTPDGQYEYLFMPFGLRNGPSVFQRFINLILKKFIEAELLVIYMDDILIASYDFETHLSTIRDVLCTLLQNGLRLQLKKCKFAYNELEYLGFLANSSGISPRRDHLKAIENYPKPNNRKELERCLGLFSYFRRFVPKFSTIASPMNKLLRKETPFVFSAECEQAFSTLRDKLLEAPVLSIYNPLSETELHCDASSAGFGAALMQKQTDGKFHPVAYFSKTTSSAEAKLHSYELETLSIVYALKRFHTYLIRIPFKLVTDCNSLALTLQNQSYSAKIARWALMLEKYDYTIVHRPGATMAHVDALSRSGVIGYIDSADIDFHLQITQNRDHYISQLRDRLEKGEVTDFVLKDGLVYHKSPTGRLQLVVPEEMINNVISIAHEKVGHLASDKCCGKIKENYWFPYMKSRVNNFIANCLKCIYYSASPSEHRSTLHCIPKKPEPFDTIHLDHLGPLPSISSKKKYLLAVIDAFTKFVKLYATATTNTREVCAALETHYFPYYSRPRRIISDRGTCFTSSEFANFLKTHNIEHIKAATASPQANGQIERINRVLTPMLAKLSEPLNHSDWASQIYKIEHALNNSIQSSTKNTPAILLFGVNQRGPIIDELTEYLNESNDEPVQDLGTIRSTAHDNINKAQEKNLKYHASHHKPAHQYSAGDYVVIKNVDTSAGHNKKLIRRFRGPYIIHKCLPNDRYVIRDIEGCQLTQLPYDGVLESSKLKPWVRPFRESVANVL